MNFSQNIQKNITALKKKLDSDDIKFTEIKAGGSNAAVVFVDSITDKDGLSKRVLLPLSQLDGKADFIAARDALAASEYSEATDTDGAVKDILDGKTLLIIDGSKTALSIDLKRFDIRAISEPPTSTVIKGPREGFNENIVTGLSMLRRRIKSDRLKIKFMSVGKFSKTSIAICYVDGIYDQKVLKTLLDRIRKIDIEAVPDSSYIAKYLFAKKVSLFKQVNATEKPDVFSMRILEGRIGIIVDGSPIAITAPYMIIEDFQSPEDYYASPYRANISRWIRIVSLIFAVLLPSFYVSAQLFHLQLIPLDFLLTIVNSIKGIPLSPSLEMFFTLLVFEILNEASIRMPKYVGQALSIVGALVLGDTAVRAGIVSTPAILIMALSGIALYTVPELAETMSVLRIVFLILAGSIGGYGIILGIAFLLYYVGSLENFGVPIAAPFAPLIKNDLKDSFYLGFLFERDKRPFAFKMNNRTRLKLDGVIKNEDKHI